MGREADIVNVLGISLSGRPRVGHVRRRTRLRLFLWSGSAVSIRHCKASKMASPPLGTSVPMEKEIASAQFWRLPA